MGFLTSSSIENLLNIHILPFTTTHTICCVILTSKCAKGPGFPAKHLSSVPVEELRSGACLLLYWAAKSLAVKG